jgi:hypothetical protein
MENVAIGPAYYCLKRTLRRRANSAPELSPMWIYIWPRHLNGEKLPWDKSLFCRHPASAAQTSIINRIPSPLLPLKKQIWEYISGEMNGGDKKRGLPSRPHDHKTFFTGVGDGKEEEELD